MRLLYPMLVLLMFTTSVALSQNYYWYKGAKIPLREGSKWYVLYENKDNCDEKYQNVVDIFSSPTKKVVWNIVDNKTLYDTKNIVYQTRSFLCFNGTQDMYVTHRFYVKLKQEKDVVFLQKLSERYHLIFEEDMDLPLWYIISCSPNSQYNALDLANIFYETELFAVSEPEFMGALRLNCVNDSLYNEQWNLMNIGQYGSFYSGIDIDYCSVHAITQGNSSVIVGIYDLGVDLTHPDINIHSFSYDADTESSPSQIYASNGKIYHGTACAGIIGAKANNSIGVTGIAPNCPIMSLSIHFGHTSSEKIKKDFITAANNGCSVISNSWGGGTSSSFIDAGISYALSHGRNGKGCVIVFASGNDNNDGVIYPANSNDSIIVVGAMSPCGERKNPYSCDGENYWGSNYGSKLDVVAPGVKIRTTDNVGIAGKTSTDYMNNFNGTSSACPHVAAIAALILSVNPELTQQEVADIIEKTARKIGSYTYSTISGRSNGTWNNEVGYGLVDANAAVSLAGTKYMQNKIYTNGSNTTENGVNLFAGYSVTDNQPYGGVVLLPGSTVRYKATNQIVLEPGFIALEGSNFVAQIVDVYNVPMYLRPHMPYEAEYKTEYETILESDDKTEVPILSNQLDIYPNYVRDKITITAHQECNSITITITIYNITGLCVLQTKQTEIDISSLSSGVYVVVAVTEDGNILQSKFVHL